ncbi:MAG TPA: transglycosylase domain-containing protein, partial [Ramlibacter sp.]|nr:transglycosylase domain-containing protein [Ramlibacter sp.]
MTTQARQADALARHIQDGFFAPYHEKKQAGLGVLDCRREPLFKTDFPQKAYPSYAAIPPLVVDTLAFIENREIVTATEATHNPALEWPRLGRALLDQGMKAVDPSRHGAGGSTLATQLEKFRHSPAGRTASAQDKYRQVVSASLRAYMDGPETVAARQRILLDYVNSLPLGAQRHVGEVVGILDGVRLWYGADVAALNQALRANATDAAATQAQARAYRQVLSLLIAQRRPAFYMGAGRDALAASTDGYLRVLAEAGVITPSLRDAALQTSLVVHETPPDGAPLYASNTKAANLMRASLAQLLDTPRLYDLDRLDLSAAGTLDGQLQESVTQSLRRLRDPQGAKAAGLIGYQLLERGDPSQMVYSFTLYERTNGANRLRVQTDNLDQPFNLNSGAKLELGSTAKLRVLVSYLEVIASLHAQLGALKPSELAGRDVSRRDALTRWAIDYLSRAQDKSLAAMLDAAMQRRYSANPGESFFTGGGAHTFSNFNAEDNGKILSVADGLRDSVNLVFVRLMRDVVQHHMYGETHRADRILEDPDHPERAALLARFADQEGSRFLRKFYA